MTDNLTYFNDLVEIAQAYWGQVENLNDFRIRNDQNTSRMKTTSLEMMSSYLPIFRLREQLKHGYNACLKKADSEWVVKSRVILISSENSNRVEQAFQTKRQEVGELFFGEIL